MDEHDRTWHDGIGNKVTASENSLNQADRILTGDGDRKLNNNIESTFQKPIFSGHGSGTKGSEESVNRTNMDEHDITWYDSVGNRVTTSENSLT